MATFTVYFESPWWVGVLEVEDMDGLRAHRVVFGPEPGWPQIWEMVNQRWNWIRETPTVAVDPPRCLNPKRAARELAKQAQEGRPSTRAQEAMAISREVGKLERKVKSREKREVENAYKREVATRKAKAKKRGR